MTWQGITQCSTPEGIEAAITGTSSARRPASPGAQRPKASKRRSPATGRLVDGVSAQCSTPEGIEAAITIVRPSTSACTIGAQRPKASKRRSLHRDARALLKVEVLNARRHRSGDHHRDLWIHLPWGVCSTPEGIEAAITARDHEGRRLGLVLNARRHRSGDHVAHAVGWMQGELCSTPEGIEAAITTSRECHAVIRAAVLNARRHRSGDHSSQ